MRKPSKVDKSLYCFDLGLHRYDLDLEVHWPRIIKYMSNIGSHGRSHSIT